MKTLRLFQRTLFVWLSSKWTFLVWPSRKRKVIVNLYECKKKHCYNQKQNSDSPQWRESIANQDNFLQFPTPSAVLPVVNTTFFKSSTQQFRKDATESKTSNKLAPLNSFQKKQHKLARNILWQSAIKSCNFQCRVASRKHLVCKSCKQVFCRPAWRVFFNTARYCCCSVPWRRMFSWSPAHDNKNTWKSKWFGFTYCDQRGT